MRKPDSQDFVAHVERLKSAPELTSRAYWIDFLFHITDIENAAKILNAGHFLSRAELERTGLRWLDAASSAVIDQTNQQFTEYVRLYFRPKTPTAYHMEGIKPQHRRYGNAHCPVPVYLIFDIRDIITLHSSRFSNGSLARSSTEIFESAEEFATLPFCDIYHDRGWAAESPKRREEIKNRRHSEVIIHNALGLETLRAVVCRSQAEYETLRNLLGGKWNEWRSKVRPASKPRRLFQLEWLFIDFVTLDDSQAQVQFNLPKRSDDNGPFTIRVSIDERSTNKIYAWEHNFQNISNELPELRLRLDLSAIGAKEYSFKLEVDGKLAYLGRYTPEIPF